MSNTLSQTMPQYKALGDTLLAKFGNQRSLAWLADRTLVSRVAVHLWLSGRCRPKPQRLGLIAATLGFTEEEVFELATQADYDSDPDRLDKVLRAYHNWCAVRANRQVEGLEHTIYDGIIEKMIVENQGYKMKMERIALLIDPEVKKVLRETSPELLEELSSEVSM
jgi:transcriptional regulator with XRE-family HTH domain